MFLHRRRQPTALADFGHIKRASACTRRRLSSYDLQLYAFDSRIRPLYFVAQLACCPLFYVLRQRSRSRDFADVQYFICRIYRRRHTTKCSKVRFFVLLLLFFKRIRALQTLQKFQPANVVAYICAKCVFLKARRFPRADCNCSVA